MGKRTFMNLSEATPGPVMATPRSGLPGVKAGPQRPLRLGFDVPLLLAAITLLVFGILMVYSASWDFSYNTTGSHTAILQRQMMFLGVGLVGALVLAWLNYHYWQKLAVPALAVTVIMLVAVLLVNDLRHGAVRTLMAGSGQPSELAKLVTIIYLSVWLFAKKDRLHDISFGLVPMAVILGVVGGLIFLQPDLSALITVAALGGLLFFLAGGDLKQILIILVVGGIAGWIVVQFSSTGSDRVGSFLAGLKNPLNADYQVQRSIEAFIKGGWIGVGIGKGDTKLLGLPVPHTDSIFAVVGEETGFIGSIFLVGLYVVLGWRGLVIARRASDGLGALLASGLTIWLVMEAFINMLVMIGLLPFAGNALPFISVGGSNLVVSLAAIGILMNISRNSERQKTAEERTFSEVVDLRGRYGRRRVSGARRAASSDSRPQTADRSR